MSENYNYGGKLTGGLPRADIHLDENVLPCANEYVRKIFYDVFGNYVKEHVDIADIKLNGDAMVFAKDPKTIIRLPSLPTSNGINKGEVRYFVDPKDSLNDLPHLPRCPYNSTGEKNKCFDRIYYTDMVGFKAFNDTFGEHVGDCLMNFYFHFIQSELLRLSNQGKLYFVVRRGQGDEILAYRMSGYFPAGCPFHAGKDFILPKSSGMHAETDTDFFNLSSSFRKQKLWVTVPRKNNYGENLCEFALKPDNAMSDELIPEEADKEEYRFRYQISGLDFRYGSADSIRETETHAWIRAKNQNKKAERGGFYKSVRLRLVVKGELGKPKLTDIMPNDQIVLVVDGNKDCLIITEHLKNYLEKVYEVISYEDAFYDVSYIIVRRPNFKKDLEKYEADFIEAIKARFISLSTQKASMEGELDTDFFTLKTEIEVDGAVEASSEYIFIDYQYKRLSMLNDAFIEALEVFQKDTKDIRSLDKAMRILAKAHVDDSISSLWREVKRALMLMSDYYISRVYSLSNEQIISQ